MTVKHCYEIVNDVLLSESGRNDSELLGFTWNLLGLTWILPDSERNLVGLGIRPVRAECVGEGKDLSPTMAGPC